MRSQALLHPVTPPRMRTSQWALAIRFLTIGICFLATLPLAAGQVPDTLLHTFPNPAPGAGRVHLRFGAPPLVSGQKGSHTLKRGLHTSSVRSPAFRLGSCTQSQMTPGGDSRARRLVRRRLGEGGSLGAEGQQMYMDVKRLENRKESAA